MKRQVNPKTYTLPPLHKMRNVSEIKLIHPDPIDGEIWAKVMNERAQGNEFYRFQSMTREEAAKLYPESYIALRKSEITFQHVLLVYGFLFMLFFYAVRL